MEYTNILSKLFLLLKLLLKYKILLINLILIIILDIYSKKNVFLAKWKNILLCILFFLVYCFYFIKNHIFITKTFNELIINVFKNIYFPSVYFILFIYLSFLVIFIIIYIIKFPIIYKHIIKISFALINIIMILFINIVADNKINIFSRQSLYTNKNVLCILELFVLIFIVTLLIFLILIISNIINKNLQKNNELLIKDCSKLNQFPNEYEKDNNVNVQVKIDEEINNYEINEENEDVSNIIINKSEDLDKFISPVKDYEKLTKDFYLDNNLIDNSNYKYKAIPNLNQLEVIKKPQINIPMNTEAKRVEYDTKRPSLTNKNDNLIEDLKISLKILKLLKIHSRYNCMTKKEALKILKENNYTEKDFIKFEKILNEIIKKN